MLLDECHEVSQVPLAAVLLGLKTVEMKLVNTIFTAPNNLKKDQEALFKFALAPVDF